MKNLKNVMNSSLVNDILTGLMIAATFAAVVPADAFADLNSASGASGSNVLTPVLKVVSYISYGLGGVMVVAGIAGAKKHADSPGNNPLGPALGKLGAGAAFLVAPAAIQMLQSTGTDVLGGGGSAVQTIPGV